MNSASPCSSPLAGKLVLCGLTCIGSISVMQAAPPPSSFGVWDRGSSFDHKEYPFLRGLTCHLQWQQVEQKPGVFDWSRLDAALQKAVAQNEFV